MKKKIMFAIATCFFAVATVFNMNMLQVNSAGDISLDAIAVMAQAQSNELPEVKIICSSGGDGRCYAEGNPRVYIGPLGLPMCETTCYWTGATNDHCVAGMPC